MECGNKSSPDQGKAFKIMNLASLKSQKFPEDMKYVLTSLQGQLQVVFEGVPRNTPTSGNLQTKETSKSCWNSKTHH